MIARVIAALGIGYLITSALHGMGKNVGKKIAEHKAAPKKKAVSASSANWVEENAVAPNVENSVRAPTPTGVRRGSA